MAEPQTPGLVMELHWGALGGFRWGRDMTKAVFYGDDCRLVQSGLEEGNTGGCYCGSAGNWSRGSVSHL